MTSGSALGSPAPHLAQIAVAQVPAAIVILVARNEQFVVDYVNPAFERLSGYSLVEARGLCPTMFVRASSGPPMYVSRDEVEGLAREAVPLRTRRGDELLVEVDVQLLTLDEGSAALLVVRDVTEVRRLEQIAAATEVSESVGYVFAGIRHELTNPLNSLKAVLTLLADPTIELPAARRDDYLRRALGEIERMEALLEQLRTFNANETVNLAPLAVGPFLDRFLRLVHKDCAARGTTIVLDEVAHVSVVTDRRLLHQILLVLLTNALDAVQMTDERVIRLSCHATPRAVRLVMADTGPGMTPQQLAHAQRPFVTTKIKGTGLGLPLAHRYAAWNRCRLELTSQPGVGTTCTLHFDPVDSIET